MRKLTNRVYRACIYTIPFVIGWYLLIGRVFLYAGGVIHATDLETPLNPTFYFWYFLYPSHPSALGSVANPATYNIIYGLIAIFSFGNAFVSQVILLSLPPIIAYTGTLLLTKRILKGGYVANVFSSFFYAFSPPYLSWFSLPYMLGVALIPWLLYVGICAFESILNHKRSLGTSLFYSLMFAFILSLVTGIYFHILLLLPILLAIPLIFIMISLSFKVTTQHIFRLCVFVCLTGLLYLLMTPQIFNLLSASGKSVFVTPLNLIKKFYLEASILNNLRLASGTPCSERVILLQSNPVGMFIPILVFSGLLSLKDKDIKEHFPRKIILLYVSFIVNSIVLLMIAYIFRELAFSNNLVVTKPYLAGLRRPERILEMLSLFYSLGMAFSISVIECKLRKYESAIFRKLNCKNLKFPLSLSCKKFSSMLLMILMLLYIYYSGMYLEPNHQVTSQLFTSRPADFKVVEDFLNRDDIQASRYDAVHRYLILPLYSPLIAYLRYNYPNIFYAGSFAPDGVQNLIMTANELIAEKDPSVIWPLSLSSVKYIAILPSSFSENELQSWRLRGKIRASGASLFGDPRNYNAFISNLSSTRLLYENEITVYVNELAIPRVFVPTMLVYTQGNLKNVFRSLNIINSVLPLSNFVLVVNQSEEAKNNHGFVIDDFERQMQIEINISSLTEHNFKYKFREDAVSINKNSIIVWSQQKTVSIEDNFIIIRGIIPSDKQYLSMWVRIPPMNLSSLLNIQLIASSEIVDNISFSAIDQEGNILPVKIEKTLSPTTNNKTYLDILVNPMHQRPAFFRVILKGTPNSTVEIALRNEIVFKEIDGMELNISNKFDIINQGNKTIFPIIVSNRHDTEVLWPVSIKENTIEYAITDPIEIDNASFAIISTNKGTKWHKVNEKVRWLSPVNIGIDLELSLLGEEKEILVPLFLGNAYDKSWNLHVSTNSGRITEIVHMLGNGYGNLWLVKISEIQDTGENLSLSFNVCWDSLELCLYRMYMFGGVMPLILTVAFYIFLIKRNKLSMEKF